MTLITKEGYEAAMAELRAKEMRMLRPCRHDFVDNTVGAMAVGALHAGDPQAIECLAELRSADDLRYAIRAASEAVCSTTGAERLSLEAWHDRAVKRRNELLGVGEPRWWEQALPNAAKDSVVAAPPETSEPPQAGPIGHTFHPDGTVTLDQLASDGRGGLYVKREGDRGEPKTTYELALEHSVRVKQQRIEELEANNAALRRLADGRSELEKSYQEITRDNTLVRAQAVRLRCELEQLRERFAALPGPKRGGVEIACQNDEEEP